MNYTEITSLKELQAARKRLQEDLQRQEKTISQDFHQLKKLVSPMYWVQRILDNFGSLKRTVDFGRRIYQAIHDYWLQRKEAREEKRRAEEAASAGIEAEELHEMTSDTPQEE